MGAFELVNSKVLKADLAAAGSVLARKGAMLYYTGDVGFVPATAGGVQAMGAGGFGGPGQGMSSGSGMGGMAGGLMGAALRGMSGEFQQMMAAQGHGVVHYGYAGLHVTLVQLNGEPMCVEASRLLAHTAGLQSSVVSVTQASGGGGGGGGGGGLRGLMRGAVAGVATGQGMWTTQLTGAGEVALLSHGGTFELPVTPNGVVVDPQAYVAHRGNVQVQFSASLGWRDAVGRGSGEATQLQVTGQGVVYVQASEEKL